MLGAGKSVLTDEERKAAVEVDGTTDASKVTKDTDILKLYRKQFKVALWDCANAMADASMFGTDAKVALALAYVEEKLGGKRKATNAWLEEMMAQFYEALKPFRSAVEEQKPEVFGHLNSIDALKELDLEGKNRTMSVGQRAVVWTHMKKLWTLSKNFSVFKVVPDGVMLAVRQITKELQDALMERRGLPADILIPERLGKRVMEHCSVADKERFRSMLESGQITMEDFVPILMALLEQSGVSMASLMAGGLPAPSAAAAAAPTSKAAATGDIDT